jgi:hypothetical protein
MICHTWQAKSGCFSQSSWTSLSPEETAMQNHLHSLAAADPGHAHQPLEDDAEMDVDNDPGNEDPGSQFDRDATVPLIDPDE